MSTARPGLAITTSRVVRWLAYLLAGSAALILFVLIGFRTAAVVRERVDRAEAAPGSGRFVHAADVDMYIQEWGPKTGPPVVFLHAAGGWSGAWAPTGEVLARNGLRAIAVDMPPLGFSERPRTPRYSREDQAARLVGVLDALSIDQATIVGHSFGGRVAAQVALAHPGRVSKLVLVDAALSFPKPGEHPSPLLDGLMAFRPLRASLASMTFTNPLVTRKLVQSFVANPATVTDYWVGVYQAAIHVKGTSAAIGDWLPQLVAERDTSMSNDRASYGKLAMPVRIIWGDKDTTTPLDVANELASLIPGSRLIVLSGLGHLPPVENPEVFNLALLEVLRD